MTSEAIPSADRRAVLNELQKLLARRGPAPRAVPLHGKLDSYLNAVLAEADGGAPSAGLKWAVVVTAVLSAPDSVDRTIALHLLALDGAYDDAHLIEITGYDLEGIRALGTEHPKGTPLSGLGMRQRVAIRAAELKSGNHRKDASAHSEAVQAAARMLLSEVLDVVSELNRGEITVDELIAIADGTFDEEEHEVERPGLSLGGVIGFAAVFSFIAAIAWVFWLAPVWFHSSNNQDPADAAAANRPWSAGWGPVRSGYPPSDLPDKPTINGLNETPPGTVNLFDHTYLDERQFVYIDNGPPFFTVPQSHEAIPPYLASYQIGVEISDSAQSSPPSKVEIEGLRLRLGMLVDGTGTAVFARLSASNTPAVWDAATVDETAGQLFAFDRDSAILTSDRYPHGVRLPQTVFSSRGALVGGDLLDGRLLPGQPLSVVVTVEIPD